MIIQELKPSQRIPGRWLAVMEDGSILRLGEEEVLSFSLYQGREITPEEADSILESARRTDLKGKALRALSHRPMSRRELLRKLLTWGAEEEEGDALCDRMEELGYLDDDAYARNVVCHYAAKGYGPARLRDELYRRGVPRTCWEGALAQAEDTEEAVDAFLRKKLGSERPDGTELKRVSDALARRGFSWNDIREGLRRYGAEVWDD